MGNCRTDNVFTATKQCRLLFFFFQIKECREYFALYDKWAGQLALKIHRKFQVLTWIIDYVLDVQFI